MIELIAFISNNWQLILSILTIGLILSLIKPIKMWIGGVSEGMREALTPGGFVILLILLIVFFLLKDAIFGVF